MLTILVCCVAEQQINFRHGTIPVLLIFCIEAIELTLLIATVI
jgi:hypothetical protein